MDSSSDAPQRPSIKKHNQDFILKILVPVLAAVLLVLFLIILTILTSGKDPSIRETWASISLVILILPFLVIGVILLALSIVAIWLLSKTTKPITRYSLIIGDFFDQVRNTTQKISTSTAQPMIYGKAVQAGLFKFLSMLVHGKPES
jgi:hypothetical protein